tara:strand:+ start:19640 stop:20596 length:957 start_codon:yes stop_codon:yes gene_type:complete
MNEEIPKIIVTGCSGYVASDLIPKLKKFHEVFGIDIIKGPFTNLVGDISSIASNASLKHFNNDSLIIINLAAARFDFGATAADYYKFNVKSHHNFMQALNGLKIIKFIHISSVASLDGRDITYCDELNCDDAYRSTKYLQEVLIEKWCHDRNIELTILYPSAIFSNDPRSDTNIGKLQSLAKILPFVPQINVVKSLTYLPNFSKFIVDLVFAQIPAGKYLTIQSDSLTVSKMIQIISGRSIRVIKIPLLQQILKTLAKILYILGLCGKIDLKLTPNRVVKLFSDTSYSNINHKDVNLDKYKSQSSNKLPEILEKLNIK